MKRLIFTIFLNGIHALATAQLPQALFSNEDVTVTPLSEKCWVMETSDMTTMYLIEGDKEALLIDTGTDVRSLDSIVRLVTRKPLRVAVTHWHPDHAGGVDCFPEIWMHPADTVLLHRKPYDGKIRYLTDGDEIDLGGSSLYVALMPGHTPGSIVFYDRTSGNCYTGDAFGSGQVWLQCEPTLPMSTYVESCRNMLRLMDEYRIERLYCGHYPYVKRPYDRHYVEAMQHLAETVIAGQTEIFPFRHPDLHFPKTTRMAVDSSKHVMIVFNINNFQ